MKKMFLLPIVITLLLFTTGWANYAIVNNSTSGQTAHDSLSIPFFLLDSAGNQVAIADGDSVFLTVWYPGGALAFADSGAYNDVDVTSQVQGGMSWYSWQTQVSDLDGTPTEGTYSYIFGIHDKTSADLWTSFTGSFQLYETSDFDKIMDSIGLAQIEVENLDGWTPHSAADVWSVGTREITGGALTTPANYKADVSALALASGIDSIYAFSDSIYDTLLLVQTAVDAVRDSIQYLITATGFSTHSAASVWAVGTRELTGKTGFALITTEWEKVWYDIDTTNIDTSEIGEWFSTGIAASISDANMGAIADSVWDKIYADMVAEAGGAGDSLWSILNDLLDTLQLYDIRLDSLLAALADANIGDKVWTDPGTRTITGGALTTPADYKADVSALSSQTSVTAIRDSIQYLITATGFSTHAAADVWAVVTRELTGKTGFALTSAEHGLIEDEVYANKNDYKATGFSTHAAADVWSVGTREITGGALTTPADYKADVSALALQADILAAIDTASFFSGSTGNANTKADTYTDKDTLWFLNGVTDTIGYRVFFHPGAGAGEPPDSTKTYTW